MALAARADSDFTSSLSTLPPEYARITDDFERMRRSVAGALTDVAKSMSDRAAASQQSVADGRKVVSEAVGAMEDPADGRRALIGITRKGFAKMDELLMAA